MPKTIVGERVRIYWSVDDKWYEALVLQFRKELGWQVQYDVAKDGRDQVSGVKWHTPVRWHMLEHEKWELIEDEGEE